MAKEKVNTTETIKKGNTTNLAALDKQITKAAKVLNEEKKVEVVIPKMLLKRLGKNVPVAVNGAVIHVPVGQKVKIPETMATVLNSMLSELKL